MSDARRALGRKPSGPRPAIPPADYKDEISDANWTKIKERVADLNDPAHKRTLVAGVDLGD